MLCRWSFETRKLSTKCFWVVIFIPCLLNCWEKGIFGIFGYFFWYCLASCYFQADKITKRFVTHEATSHDPECAHALSQPHNHSIISAQLFPINVTDYLVFTIIKVWETCQYWSQRISTSNIARFNYHSESYYIVHADSPCCQYRFLLFISAPILSYVNINTTVNAKI